jgi:hypothetical protein
MIPISFDRDSGRATGIAEIRMSEPRIKTQLKISTLIL